jgi:regulatory protein
VTSSGQRGRARSTAGAPVDRSETSAPSAVVPPTAAEAEGVAREACLRLLACRPRSRHELAQRLEDKGVEPEVAERVLNRMEQVELVDDAAFARAWVHSRHTYSGRGRRALAMELRTKGVADHHADAALAQVDDEAEAERARELVRRKLGRLTVPPEGRERAVVVRRLVGVLARRGYGQGLAFSVVRDELAAAGTDLDGLDPHAGA